jgi:hypothetical protein
MRTPLCLASGVTPFSSLVLKPTIVAPGRRGHDDVVLRDQAHVGRHDLQGHLRALDPLEELLDGLRRAEHVGLDDHLEHLLLRGGDVGEQVLDRDVLLGRVDGRDGLLEPVGLLLGEILGLAGVLRGAEDEPPSGVPDQPITRTGVEGPASLMGRPWSSNMARTLAHWAPHTMASPCAGCPSAR